MKDMEVSIAIGAPIGELEGCRSAKREPGSNKVPGWIRFDFDLAFLFFSLSYISGGAAWIAGGFVVLTLKLGDPPRGTATSLKQLKGEIRFQAGIAVCLCGCGRVPLGFLMSSPAVVRGNVQFLSSVLSELTDPRSG